MYGREFLLSFRESCKDIPPELANSDVLFREGSYVYVHVLAEWLCKLVCTDLQLLGGDLAVLNDSQSNFRGWGSVWLGHRLLI